MLNEQVFVKKNLKLALLLIFLLALIFRFLFFPQNVYFGFDQARDAFAVKEILVGNLKITGPPTANGVFNHGSLYYYIFAPFYFISGGDPSAVSLFLRVLNAALVFLLFLIVSPVFGKFAAILSAFLFSISYEQTQFSLFLNHPSLVVASVLVFYFGLSTWIFRKKARGLILAIFGMGLSIQFEFVEVQLMAIFILFLFVFNKNIPKISIKNIILSLSAFLIPTSTYIISEIKNDFLITKQVPSLLLNRSRFLGESSNPLQFVLFIGRHVKDNIFSFPLISELLGLLLLIYCIKFIFHKSYRQQLVFLSLWFFGGFLVYFINRNDAYFYNTGTSIALLIFVSFLLSKLYFRNKVIFIASLVLILISNVNLIISNNPLGPNQKINPQRGLLLENEKKIVDMTYQFASGENFAVNALTMPYNVNTTWSYLYEWYGKKKYGFIPIWGGDTAFGFPGNLKIETARSKLPSKRFLIIEPTEGIPSYLIDSFIDNESNYTNIIEKKNIGTLRVWVQQKK